MGIEAGVIGTAALLGLGGWGATNLAMGMGKKNTSAPSGPALPAAPTGAEATAAEKARIRKKSKTILTSPLGGDEYYGTAAPTLLGSGDVSKKKTLG